MTATNNDLYNEITNVIEIKYPTQLSTKISANQMVGFAGKPLQANEFIIFREVQPTKILIFTALVNINLYTQEAAKLILGSCILTQIARIKENEDLSKATSDNIKQKLDFFKVWKSSDSNNFLLAQTRQSAYQK